MTTGNPFAATIQGDPNGIPVGMSLSSAQLAALAPLVSPSASGTNGATPYSLISTASNNLTLVRAGVGSVYGIFCFNNNALPRYLKIYDKATAPVVASDTPVLRILVPASANGLGAGVVLWPPVGIKFTLGIAFALTGGVGDTDATNTGTDTLVNLLYA